MLFAYDGQLNLIEKEVKCPNTQLVEKSTLQGSRGKHWPMLFAYDGQLNLIEKEVRCPKKK